MKAFYNWLFPDTSKVKAGTLWLAKKQHFENRFCYRDLKQVGDMETGGYIELKLIWHASDLDGDEDDGFSWFENSEIYRHGKRNFVRTHFPLTKKHAEILGFKFEV